MTGPHENLEHAEHAQHASHSNRNIALIISVLALFLAFSETLGKSAQTVGIELNIKASDNVRQQSVIESAVRPAALKMARASYPALRTGVDSTLPAPQRLPSMARRMSWSVAAGSFGASGECFSCCRSADARLRSI